MRKSATRYTRVIDELLDAKKRSGVTTVVVAELMDIAYITLDKYLRKERNIGERKIAERMVAVTGLLNTLTKKKRLPIPKEINKRRRSDVALEIIDEYTRDERKA